MFYKLGLLIVTRARLVLALGLVALAISAVLGVGVFSRLLSGGFDDPASASSRAQVLLDRKFGGEPDMIFLVHARHGNVGSSAVAASGQALAKRLDGDPRLTGVTSYWATRAPGLRSRDGSDALILARVAGDDAQAASNATALLAAYAHLDNRAVTVRIGGALGTDIGGQVGKDLAVAESIAVPVTLVLLVIAFGSIVSALLPLAVAVAAIFGTLAELSLLTHVTSVSIFAINLTTALGLGLGIDYALLMVSRFREELSHGGDVGEAVARTTATAGRTIAFSALTVAVAVGDARVPDLLPQVLRLRRRRSHCAGRGERPAGAARGAGGPRAPHQRRPRPRDPAGAQRRGAVLGTACRRRHAPADPGRSPGDRRAAVAGHATAQGHLRHPR